MTSQEAIARVLELDRNGATGNDQPWRWRMSRDGGDRYIRLDDCNGNWLIEKSDEDQYLRIFPEVADLITEYRTLAPKLARALSVAVEALKIECRCQGSDISPCNLCLGANEIEKIIAGEEPK